MHDRFPCEAVLKDGKRLLLRRLERHDEAALNAFFQRLPTQIRRLAWQDLNSSVIHEWIQNIDYEKALPVIALDGTRVVGDATLHYREGGPLRLVGRIRWMIDPEYNGVGLGTTFGHHFIHIAKQNGLRHLSCMLATRLEAIEIEELETLGFTSHKFPGYGADPDGKAHDMTLMVFQL